MNISCSKGFPCCVFLKNDVSDTMDTTCHKSTRSLVRWPGVFWGENRQYVEMPNSFLSCVYDIYIYILYGVYIFLSVNIYCILLYINYYTTSYVVIIGNMKYVYIHISNDYIYITIYVYSCQAFHFGKSPMHHGTKVRSRSSRSGWGETMGGMIDVKNDQGQ